MKKSTKVILSQSAITALSILTGTSSYATVDCNDNTIPQDIKNAAGCAGNTDALPNSVINIINAIIGVLSLVAVIIIIYGGIQYMTSTGDANKVKKAKDTILYAVIGLIVCVLAFAIVNFVIDKFI